MKLLPISDKQKEIGVYLINTLDSDGYLRRTISDISDELSFVQNTFVMEEELEEVLAKIKTLELMGIGCRNLQECLLVQLQHKKEKTRDTYNAIAILEKHMDQLSTRSFDAIKKLRKLDDEEFADALAEIKKLNPSPCRKLKRVRAAKPSPLSLTSPYR